MKGFIKKSTAILLTVLMLLTVAPLNGFVKAGILAFAEETTTPAKEEGSALYSGTCGSDLTWSLYGDGRLVISGTGTMYGLSYEDWQGYAEQITHIEVSEGVTGLCDYAFNYLTALKSVSLPTTLIDIGETTFQGCSSLTEIIIPEKVEKLNDFLFNRCSSLRKIVVLNPDIIFEDLYNIPNACVFFGYNGSTTDTYTEENDKPFLSLCSFTDSSHTDNNRDGICDICNESSIAREGTCGDSAAWRLYSDGLLTVEGSGEVINKFGVSSRAANRVEVKKGITSIGVSAFESFWALAEVSLPEGLLTIGPRAFAYCYLLKEVTIPETVQEIKSLAFYSCDVLEKIVIPAGVEIIWNSAFANCDALEEVVFSEGLKKIFENAFAYTPKLRAIAIPASVSFISATAFSGAVEEYSVHADNVKYTAEDGVLYTRDKKTIIRVADVYTDFTVPDSVEIISMYAFSGCATLRSVIIPDTVKHIGEGAFSNCSSLENVTLPDGIKEIKSFMFKDTKALKTVIIPDSVESIGANAFYSSGIEEISLSANLKKIGHSAFCSSSLRSVVIPDSVTEIAIYAFWYCKDLTQVTLPEQLESIGRNAFSNTAITEIIVPAGVDSIYSDAFDYCNSLESILFSSDTEDVAELYLKNTAFYKNQNNWENGALYINDILVAVDKTVSGTFTVKEGTRVILSNAFLRCDQITEIVIPEGVEKIGQNAFRGCSSLMAVQLPSSLEEITMYMFDECTALAEINIPDGVKEICANAFYDCSALEKIEIPESVEMISGSAFIGTAYYNNEDNWTGDALYFDEMLVKVKKTASGVFSVREGTKIICDQAFESCSGLTEILIPESVTSIGYSAFQNCFKLKDISLPSGLLKLDSSAFIGCEALESITIPEGINEIPGYCFYSCDALKTVNMHDNITAIGACAFYACSSLSEMKLPEEVLSIGDAAFAYCESLKDIEFNDKLASVSSPFTSTAIEKIALPESVVSADRTFSNCKTLTEISSFGSVTELVYGELYYCRSLQSIALPSTLKSIDDKAFSPLWLTELSEVSYDGCEHQWDEIIIGSDNDALTDLDINFAYSYEAEITRKATCEEDGIITYTCICGEVKTETIPKRAHNFDDGVIDPDSTCFNKGVITYTCTNAEDDKYEKCGYSYSEEVKEKDHLMGEWYPVTDATCTENGTEKRDCTRDGCDYYETRSTATDPANHTADDKFTVVTKADCFTDGEKAIFCTECNEKLQSEAIEKRAHVFDEGKITKEATCVEQGEITYTCTNTENEEYFSCDHSYTEKTAKAQHNMGQWFVTVSPTCSSEGLEKRECQQAGCDYFEERTIAVDENVHDEEDSFTVVKKASCTEKGEKVRKCADCGDVLTVESIPVREHIYDNGTVSSAPTCILKGEMTYTCINGETEEYEACSHSYTAEIKENGHDMGAWFIEKEAEYHVPGVERRDCNTAGCNYYETREYEIAVPVYVATFVIGEQIISRVEFEHGATHIKEPAIPEKENYIGIWEDYEIVNEDFTVEGYYELIDSDTVSKLEGEKTAEYKNDVAEITLSAFAPTKIIEYVSHTSDPLDIVLVLDQSGSMAQKLNGKTTKQAALKKSATAFLNEVLENAETAGVDHRVAVVGFAYGAKYGYNNTELLSYASNGRITPVKYDTIKKNAASMETYYSNAFLDISDGDGINDLLTAAIESVDADGATAADFGLEMASKIFDYNYTDPTEGRKKIVLFITDGEPNYYNGFDTEVANSAITEAFAMKQAGCRIYSVGINATADSNVFDNSATSFNRFLHLVSSNYKNATTMVSSGAGQKDNGFYLAVNNTDNLDQLFDVIVSRTVNKTVAFDNVTFVDTISSDFTLTLQQEEKLREQLYYEYGIIGDNFSVTRNADGTTTLKFMGLKPEKVYENGINTGFKVSVTFEVTPNEGANDKGKYKTNTEDAGVEIGEDRVLSFPIPEITVPANRNIVVYKINDEIYAIVNGKAGEAVSVPDCEYAQWNIADGTVISDRVTVYDADIISDDKYSVTWVIGGKTTVEYYTVGSKLIAPEVKADEGYMFAGFAPYVPSRMPARNIVLIAKFEEHEHKYEEAFDGGMCDTGFRMRYTCYCGNSYVTTLEPQAHKYCSTVINSTERFEDAFVCEYCQHMLDASLSFCYNDGTKNSDFYSLEMKKGEITVQPDGKVTVKIPLSSDMATAVNKGHGVAVYRVDSNNNRVPVDAFIQENAFVIVELDHFSLYVLGLTDSNGNLLEVIDYKSIECAFNGHAYTKTVIAPTCITNGYTAYNCSVCHHTYEDDIVGMTDHKDNNGDFYCDECNTYLSNMASCDHLCHKSGFVGFIWKIVRFFWKLFSMNPTCSCGAAHY